MIILKRNYAKSIVQWKNTKDYAKFTSLELCAFVLLFVCWNWHVGFPGFPGFLTSRPTEKLWFWRMVIVSMLLAVSDSFGLLSILRKLTKRDT
jgi:hypothetical protein